MGLQQKWPPQNHYSRHCAGVRVTKERQEEKGVDWKEICRDAAKNQEELRNDARYGIPVSSEKGLGKQDGTPQAAD